MSHRSHPAVALALATALVGAAPAPPALADDAEDTDEILHCVTWAITPEEFEAGAVSETECWPADEFPEFRFSGVLLSYVFDGAGGTGDFTDLRAPSCNGAMYNFTGTFWDNKISSVQPVCGATKHYTGVYSGSNQLFTGSSVQNMNATLNNTSSSADFA